MAQTCKSLSSIFCTAGFVLGLGVLAASAHALDPSTTDPVVILRAVSDSQSPKSSLARMKMTVKDSGGTRERVFSLRTKRYPDSTKTLMLAEAPAELRDTGVLGVSYPKSGRPDEQWMYLPKLHRVTRVANSSKADPLMGSDFTLSDLSLATYDSSAFAAKLVDAAGKVGNEDCWIIESVPRKADVKSATGYEKLQLWVSKEKLTVLQFKGWLVNGERTKYFKASDLRSIGGVWTAQRLSMRTLDGSTLISETMIDYQSVSYDASEVSDSDFTQQRLEQGV